MVPQGGASKESGIVDDGNFHHFHWLFVWKLETESLGYTGYSAPRWLFSDPRGMTLNDPE